MPSKRDRAAVLLNEGLELGRQGRRREEARRYREAAALDPTWSAPRFNLGLLYKRARRWASSLKYNRQAVRVDPANEAAWWNLGIAATALGRWKLARAAWRGFGIEVPDGAGPIDYPCGFGPIRLDPDGNAEVVWAQRLDPARAEIANIPFPESGHRWKDVVLNDGAPQGYRQHGGRQVPVFNAIQLLEPSPFGTFIAQVALPPEPELLVRLAETAAQVGGSAEDWSTSVRLLCKACSEGRPHGSHDQLAAPPDGVRAIGIAARNRRQARQILKAWAAAAAGVRVESLEEALAPGAP